MAGRGVPGRNQAGLTLAEMLTVVAVLAVTATIAIPRADPQAVIAADAVAAEIARAVRFARQEAIRSGSYQKISVDPGSQTMRIVRPTSSSDLATGHPVDKRPYVIRFQENSMPHVTIVSSVFNYEGGASTNYAVFGPDGAPVYPMPAKLATQAPGMVLGASDAEQLKEEGKVTIRHGDVERVVRVAPRTGRVTF